MPTNIGKTPSPPPQRPIENPGTPQHKHLQKAASVFHSLPRYDTNSLTPIHARKIGLLERESTVVQTKLRDCLQTSMTDEGLLAAVEGNRLEILRELQDLPMNSINKSTLQAIAEREMFCTNPRAALPKGIVAELQESGAQYRSDPVKVRFDTDNPNHKALLALEESITILEIMQQQAGITYSQQGPVLHNLRDLRTCILQNEWPEHFTEEHIDNVQLTDARGKLLWRSDLALFPPPAHHLNNERSFLQGILPVKTGIPEITNQTWQNLSQHLLPDELQSLIPPLNNSHLSKPVLEYALNNQEILASADFDDESTITGALGQLQTPQAPNGVKYDPDQQQTVYDPDNPNHQIIAKASTLKALNAGLREHYGDLYRQGQIQDAQLQQLTSFLEQSDKHLNTLFHEACAETWPDRFSPTTFSHQTLVTDNGKPIFCTASCYPRNANYLC